MFSLFRFMICVLLITAGSALAGVSGFRLNQERIWLDAEEEPLDQLLGHFARAGVRVEIDPSVRKTVSGSWQDRDVERVLKVVLSPCNYQLDWQRETGPLGSFIRLTGIRVYREGRPGDVRPLQNARRIKTSLDGAKRFMAREILVRFGPDASTDDLQALLTRLGGTVIASSPELGIYRILLPEGANVLALLDALMRDPNIARAEPNYIYDLPGLQPGSSSPATDSSKWKAPEGDSPVAVAVLDSGLIPDEALSAAVLSAFDATNPDAPLTSDAIGHGTLMAQLAAGLVDPYNTAVGEGVPVVAVKAFADDGSADAFTLMSAMTYAVQNSDGPLSLSWGSETPSALLEDAIAYAVSEGTLVFAAVGNENTGKPMYPAACSGVIGVAASDGDQLAAYSNRGDFVDIIAPGSAGGSQGTSVATAYVSHIAAKYQRIHPDASPADISAALKKAAGKDGILSENEVKQLLIR